MSMIVRIAAAWVAVSAVSTSAGAQTLTAQVGFSIDDKVTNTATVGPVTTTATRTGRTAEAIADYSQQRVATTSATGGIAGGTAWSADVFTITGPTPGAMASFTVTFRVTGALTVPDDRAGANPAVIGDNYAQFAAWLFGLPPAGAPCVGLHLRNGPGTNCSYSVTEIKRRTYNLLWGDFTYEDTLENDWERTYTVQLEVGKAYSVRHELMAQSWISGMISSTAAADMTAVLHLDPVSLEYGYTTASGRDYRTPVTNTAPTASAGQNQTVRPGTTVQLDGSGSFDDNTPTNLLQYSWSFVSVPDGSQVTLTGANTSAPSFTPDLHGSYVLRLVVTDEGGLSSPPSEVTIGENPPPTADAGSDQVVFVNSIVQLAGTGADADNDPLTYAWSFSNVPAGSAAQISNPLSPTATFIPDRAGVYTVRFVVSDAYGPGEPDSTRITAITSTDFAQLQLQAAITVIRGLPASAVATKGNQNALIQHLSQAVVALQANDLVEARQKIEQAISRVDGCGLRGTVDGNGPSRDWVTTCDAQGQVYALLISVLGVLAP